MVARTKVATARTTNRPWQHQPRAGQAPGRTFHPPRQGPGAARPTHKTVVSAQALLDHFVEMFGEAAERSPPWDHERKYNTRVYV